MTRSERAQLLRTVALATLFATGVVAFVTWSGILAQFGRSGARTPPAAVTRPSTVTRTPVPTVPPRTAPEGVSRETTSTVPQPVPPTPLPGEQAFAPIPPTATFPRFDAQDGPLEILQSGLDAISGGRIEEARAVRDSLPETSLDRHILAWSMALAGGDDVPSAEIARVAQTMSAWPGMTTLRRNLERAVYREQPPAAQVIRTLAGDPVLTPEGAVMLARAHIALGDVDAARRALLPLWRTARLDGARESSILTEFGSVIPVADQRFRMERMLYAERIQSAQRVTKIAGAEALFNAWSAVLRRDPASSKLLDAVPAEQRSAGYLFAKATYLRRKNRISEAAEIVLQAPGDKAELVDADAWWTERRLLSRKLLDAGKASMAYRVAAIHGAESPASAVDAEFQAGWMALRSLRDPAAAAKHFARIAELSEGAISRSRAYYWLGRSAEAGGPGDSKTYYEKAASYGTTFYGQLAAAKLKRVSLNVSYPEPTVADRANFDRREAVRAVQRLQSAGAQRLADTLYLDIAEDLSSPGELALLAGMAEARGNHYLALKVGKIAAQRGVDIGALSHPLGAIPAAADINASGKALAYAIARQESEFNPGAVSQAGALGLLQLMPGTAEQVARKTGLAYSRSRLTSDAGYNATLGAAFLGQQLDRFDGSYILTFAGYNAGPRRAEQWIARYGDPRGKDLDEVIDWIERIPFSETRAYVQRVMENYEVYKMRITGRYDIVGDLTKGR